MDSASFAGVFSLIFETLFYYCTAGFSSFLLLFFEISLYS